MRHSTTPDLKSATYMGHDLGASFHTEFAIRIQRELFLAQPPQLQREQLARVIRIVQAEKARGQVQPSWLARYWHRIYGV